MIHCWIDWHAGTKRSVKLRSQGVFWSPQLSLPIGYTTDDAGYSFARSRSRVKLKRHCEWIDVNEIYDSYTLALNFVTSLHYAGLSEHIEHG